MKIKMNKKQLELVREYCLFPEHTIANEAMVWEAIPTDSDGIVRIWQDGYSQDLRASSCPKLVKEFGLYPTIIRTQEIERGFGWCTAAVFRKLNGEFDYCELCEPLMNEYQNSIRPVRNVKLVGKRINELWKNNEVYILPGKWHGEWKFDEEGKIISLIC